MFIPSILGQCKCLVRLQMPGFFSEEAGDLVSTSVLPASSFPSFPSAIHQGVSSRTHAAEHAERELMNGGADPGSPGDGR